MFFVVSIVNCVFYFLVENGMDFLYCIWQYCPVQFSSVAQLCPTLCNSMDRSTPGFLIQICVHWVGDAIQPSHPLLSPSPPAFNHSQHQRLFQWISSSHQVAKALELQLQPQSFQWIFRIDFLYDWLVWSPCCPRDSQESSPTPQQGLYLII